jgi:hypothetical protein
MEVRRKERFRRQYNEGNTMNEHGTEETFAIDK